MADFYMDTDTGSDSDNGTTWALAKLTLEGLLAVMSAGDRGFIQGSATDTAASTRNFVHSGTPQNPCTIVGVADGTTNEPPVVSDLASTLPFIEVTGAGNDIELHGGLVINNLKFDTPDRYYFNDINDSLEFNSCYLVLNGLMTGTGQAEVVFNNSTVEIIVGYLGTQMYFNGGAIIFTGADQIVVGYSGTGTFEFNGVDLSQGTTGLSYIQDGNGAGATIKLRNCKMPATYSLSVTQLDICTTSIELIGCSDTSSQAIDSSIQDYEYADFWGTVDSETTIVRTGGANDNASGLFSYAMTPHANTTLESSNATLKSPWMSTWVQAGTQTLTVYVCNDGGVDYNEDEMWVEWLVPDTNDTAQHDLTFSSGNSRLFPSSTANTDDSDSTWGGTGANGQKFELAVNPGFQGEARARLHVAKRQATPDTVYLDPRIAVS